MINILLEGFICFLLGYFTVKTSQRKISIKKCSIIIFLIMILGFTLIEINCQLFRTCHKFELSDFFYGIVLASVVALFSYSAMYLFMRGRK